MLILPFRRSFPDSVVLRIMNLVRPRRPLCLALVRLVRRICFIAAAFGSLSTPSPYVWWPPDRSTHKSSLLFIILLSQPFSLFIIMFLFTCSATSPTCPHPQPFLGNQTLLGSLSSFSLSLLSFSFFFVFAVFNSISSHLT